MSPMSVLSKQHRKWLGAGLTGLLLGSAPAMAQEVDINFAGFATLAYGKTITSDKKEGAMHELSNEGEYRDFNRLGFRMDADMKDNLTFTAQILAHGGENYDPTFDWIFATYQLHPEWAISVGRIRVPVFMFSDYLDTSYAYQWLEPPKTIYNLSQTPFKSIEGLKLAYTTNIGDWTSELLLWGGKGEDRFTEAGVDADLILEDSVGTAWTVGYEWLSLRGFYYYANSSLDLMTNPEVAGLMDNVETIETLITVVSGGALNPEFQDALLWEKDRGQFYGLGASFDFDTFFIIGEMSRIDIAGSDSNLVAPRLDSYYVTAGVRLPSDLTLSLTYGEDKDYVDRKGFDQFDQWLGANGLLGGPGGPVGSVLIDTNNDTVGDTPLYYLVDALAKGIRDEIISQQDYRSQNTTLTLRWDFHRSASAKFEYLYENREGQTSKDNGYDQPQAFRIGLDLVF